MGIISVETPQGIKRVEIAGEVPTEEEQNAIKAQFFSSNVSEYDPAKVRDLKEEGKDESDILQPFIDSGSTTLQVNDKQFSIDEARQLGMKDEEIVQYLTTGTGYNRPAEEGVLGQVEAAGQGMNLGLTNMLGLVPSAINYGARKVEQGVRAAGNAVLGTDASLSEEDMLFSGPDGGVLGGKNLREGLEKLGLDQIDNIEELPPEYRAAANAGRVVGETGIPLFTPFALAKAGIGVSHPLISYVINNPSKAYAQEITALTGAVQGSLLASLLAPDNQWAQMGGELVGSILSPANLILTAGNTALSGAKRAYQTSIFGGPDGVNKAAIEQIRKALIADGQDPKVVSELLEEQLKRNISQKDLTAGQLSGNPLFIALENSIATTNKEFSRDKEGLLGDALQSIRYAADQMGNAGDGTTAILRKQYFEDLLNIHVDNARNAAIKAAEGIDQADMRGASKAAFTALETAEKQVRTVETKLWEAIPKNVPASGENILNSLQGLRNRILQGETLFRDKELNTVVNNFAAKIKGAGAMAVDSKGRASPKGSSVTSGDLVRFRSRLLSLARDKRANNDLDAYSQLMKMADGALEDLSALNIPAAETARAFSVALNDRFTRTFAADALGTTRSGANKINPEQTLEKGFRSGGTSGDINLREMDEAARFADEASMSALKADQAANPPSKADPNSIEDATLIDVPNQNLSTNTAVRTAEDMGKAQEEFLTAAVSASRDPTTGAFSEQKLNKFLENNKAILARFPELRTKVENLSSAQKTATETDAVFGSAAAVEDSATAVGTAFRSDNPSENYANLAQVAIKDGPEAVEGLRRSTFDYISSRAKPDSINVDLTRLNAELFGTAGPNQKTRVEIMLENGVINQTEAEALGELVTEGIRLTNVGKNTDQLNSVVDENADLLNNIARILGAQASSSLPISGAGPSLQAAQIVSGQAKKIIDKIPRGKVGEAISRIMKDPALLAKALGDPKAKDTVTATELINEALADLMGGPKRAASYMSGVVLEGDEAPLPESETDRMLEDESVN